MSLSDSSSVSYNKSSDLSNKSPEMLAMEQKMIRMTLDRLIPKVVSVKITGLALDLMQLLSEDGFQYKLWSSKHTIEDLVWLRQHYGGEVRSQLMITIPETEIRISIETGGYPDQRGNYEVTYFKDHGEGEYSVYTGGAGGEGMGRLSGCEFGIGFKRTKDLIAYLLEAREMAHKHPTYAEFCQHVPSPTISSNSN